MRSPPPIFEFRAPMVSSKIYSNLNIFVYKQLYQNQFQQSYKNSDKIDKIKKQYLFYKSKSQLSKRCVGSSLLKTRNILTTRKKIYLETAPQQATMNTIPNEMFAFITWDLCVFGSIIVLIRVFQSDIPYQTISYLKMP